MKPLPSSRVFLVFGATTLTLILVLIHRIESNNSKLQDYLSILQDDSSIADVVGDDLLDYEEYPEAEEEFFKQKSAQEARFEDYKDLTESRSSNDPPAEPMKIDHFSPGEIDNPKHDAKKNYVQTKPVLSESEEKKILDERLQHYDNTCKWNRKSDFKVVKDINYSKLTQLFVDDNYKMIMCSVPKAATSNWQRVFNSLKFNGTKKPEEFTGYRTHRIATRFTEIIEGKPNPAYELEKRINDPEYTVFINVRHPLTRLISAWRDKFDMRAKSFQYWQKKFGNYIKNQFEKEKYLEAKPSTHYISKEAFVDYVASVSAARHDHHWISFNRFCKPCSIRYDYVAHAETSAEDADYILRKAKVDGIVKLPGQYSSSPTLNRKTSLLYQNVSRKTIETLYNVYKLDFDMFNYTIDDYLL